MSHQQDIHAHWRASLKITLSMLAIWFVVSYGFGILWVEQLNQITFFGFKLGFWFAQQGSIFTFVALTIIYVILMGRLDRKFGVSDSDDQQEPSQQGDRQQDRTQMDRTQKD